MKNKRIKKPDELSKLPFTFRKVKDHYFLSSALGSWMILNQEEFDLFRKFPNSPISSPLSEKLKDHLFLIDRNDEGSKERIYKILQRKKEWTAKGPGLFFIGLTRECNLNCRYCHISSKAVNKKNLFPPSVMDKTIAFILATPAEEITIEFQGGEPLLKFHEMQEFIKRTKEKNKAYGKKIHFCFTSNLTLLNEKMIAYLIEEKVSIGGTLDGNAEIHNFHRPFREGKKGSYHCAYKNLELLKKHNVVFGILTIVSRKSLGHEREIVNQFLNFGVRNITINKVQKLGRAWEEKNWKEIGISNEEFFVFWKNMVEYLFSLHKQGIVVGERMLSLICDKLFYDDPGFVNLSNPGGDILACLGFDHEGNIYPSDEAREIPSLCLGNVHKDSYQEILEKKKSQKIIQATILEGQFCNYCAYKPFCGVCPDLAFKNTGDLYTRHWLDDVSRCSLHQMMFDFVIEKILETPHEIEGAIYAANCLAGRNKEKVFQG